MHIRVRIPDYAYESFSFERNHYKIESAVARRLSALSKWEGATSPHVGGLLSWERGACLGAGTCSAGKSHIAKGAGDKAAMKQQPTVVL